MIKFSAFLLAAAIFSSPAFAEDTMSMDSESQSCIAIAKACLAAGYTRTDMVNKRFWQDCMRPVILGRTVSGITIDTNVVKDCRMRKIEQLKNELKDFQDSTTR